MLEVNVSLKLQPKQTELLNLCDNSIASTIGYGGSRGGGKSGALRRIMLLRRINNPGTAGLIFRRVYDDLKRNHIDKFFEEFPDLFKFYRSTDHEIVLPPVEDFPPSRIVFGYAETENEIKRKFHGVEYMDMFVDQAEQLSEVELKVMKTACRWPGVGRYACKFVLFFNPGGIGITYLKRIFSQKQYREKERPSDYAFIQAFGWDNVEWARSALIDDGLDQEDFYSWDNDKRFEYFIKETQYGQELDSLPQALRIGYLMGSFDKFAGQYFDIWDEDRQTKRFEDLGIKPWHPKWISIDWGFNHDSAVYWWAQDGEITKTYRERVISGYGPRALAQDIIDKTDMFDGEELGEIDAIYISPDTRANREGKDTIADQLGKIFTAVGMPRPRIADDDRVSGFMLMHEMLHYNRWAIGKNCPKLIENIPMFSRDDKNPEDCVKFLGDDPGDSARYGLKSRFSSREIPHDIQLTGVLEGVRNKILEQSSDLGAVHTAMHLNHLRFQESWKKTHAPVRRIKSWRPSL
jgi:phage terminase large subunit